MKRAKEPGMFLEQVNGSRQGCRPFAGVWAPGKGGRHKLKRVVIYCIKDEGK